MAVYPKRFIDQLQREVCLNSEPQRIISLVPSQTALLHYLGLEDEVVGITKFCIHPHVWFKTKTRIGGTKQYNFDKIAALQPDLIIANKEENDKNSLERLMQTYKVWVSDIYNLKDALQMISNIGNLVNKESKAQLLISKIETAFNQIKKPKTDKPLKVLYVIWHNPIMVAASHTFIDSMLHHCGFDNAAAAYQRYVTPEIQTLQVDLVMLSSEPFPFTQKHLNLYQKLFPHAKICLVNGETFSWYGSHLINAPDYFNQLIANIS
ncbi:MAG: ABC transporter substrate-binding protein [Bacteroidia bacterium]|nr:ABC transporter substrate-binding protein [Bacteroidia bacterium]